MHNALGFAAVKTDVHVKRNARVKVPAARNTEEGRKQSFAAGYESAKLTR